LAFSSYFQQPVRCPPGARARRTTKMDSIGRYRILAISGKETARTIGSSVKFRRIPRITFWIDNQRSAERREPYG
jgi:hypothetical protein